eukprot:2121248-Pleurochrysis_carterae.AAC.2
MALPRSVGAASAGARVRCSDATSDALSGAPETHARTHAHARTYIHTNAYPRTHILMYAHVLTLCLPAHRARSCAGPLALKKRAAKRATPGAPIKRSSLFKPSAVAACTQRHESLF